MLDIFQDKGLKSKPRKYNDTAPFFPNETYFHCSWWISYDFVETHTTMMIFFLLGNQNKTLKDPQLPQHGKWIRSRISCFGGCPGFVVPIYLWFALERKHNKVIVLLLLGGKNANKLWLTSSFLYFLFLLLLVCLTYSTQKHRSLIS